MYVCMHERVCRCELDRVVEVFSLSHARTNAAARRISFGRVPGQGSAAS